MKVGLALSLVLVLATGAARAQDHEGTSTGTGQRSTSGLCDRVLALTAAQQDQVLRFAAVVREELDASDAAAVLISRSGTDLSRFHIRYSHAAVGWRSAQGAWSARQLYYACSEGKPRLFDQGLAGFAMGIDDPTLGYVSIVRMPVDEARAVAETSQDTTLALGLVSSSYSADAYPFSTRHQNCNQWLVELLAVAWGRLPDSDDLREQAQHWLREAHYDPEPVDVGSHALMFVSSFVPFLYLDDQPEDDRYALKLQISLPSTIEAFVKQRLPGSERIEICHQGGRVVVHQGWTPVPDGCVPGPGDRVVLLD